MCVQSHQYFSFLISHNPDAENFFPLKLRHPKGVGVGSDGMEVLPCFWCSIEVLPLVPLCFIKPYFPWGFSRGGIQFSIQCQLNPWRRSFTLSILLRNQTSTDCAACMCYRYTIRVIKEFAWKAKVLQPFQQKLKQQVRQVRPTQGRGGNLNVLFTRVPWISGSEMASSDLLSVNSGLHHSSLAYIRQRAMTDVLEDSDCHITSHSYR